MFDLDLCEFEKNNLSYMKKIIIQNKLLLIKNVPIVFQSMKPSFMLAENIKINPGDRVCDIGTGCGLYAILAAKLGAFLSCGSDISSNSVNLARENAALNKVSSLCKFKQGSLFEPFALQQFDKVISNPPQTPRKYLKKTICMDHKTKNIFIALDGGKTGSEFSLKLVSESYSHLVRGGYLYLLIIKWHHWRKIISAMQEFFSHADEICCKKVSINNLSPSFIKFIFRSSISDNLDWLDKGLNIGVYKAVK